MMTYREKKQLYQLLTQLMEKRQWDKAIETADALRQSDVTDRTMFQAILAAYIDGNDAARAEAAGVEYQQRFPLDGISRFYLGRVAFMNGDWETAEKQFTTALADQTLVGWYRGAVHSILATLYRQTARGEKAAQHYLESAQYKDLAHGQATEYSNYLFNLHYLDKPQSFMRQAAEKYGQMLAQIPQYRHEKRRSNSPKIRIGYISPDLHFHVVAFFSYAFLHDYDKRRFEVFCYTDCEEDNASREFAAMVDHWQNVRGLPDEKVAELVYKDKLDILVDLTGHTAWGFLQTMAYKPVPVQVSGIGYFDTIGLPAIDYFLADHYTDPPENDAYFVEKLIRLPHSHFCFMWHDNPQQPAPAPFQKNGYVTFGSFNNFSKVTDEMLKLWGEILAAVPGSRLFLKAAIFNNDYGRKLALARIERAGIPADRLILGEQEAKYLQAYDEMDIALDTYPYPGGGTTCDALYMGVPVITLVGERHNARFGYSLLMNAGLSELCAFSPEEYVEKAVALANDKERLRGYHQSLRQQLLASPVMQAADYMGEIEQAFTRIHLDWLERDFSQEERWGCQCKEEKELVLVQARQDLAKVVEIAGRMTARFPEDAAKAWTAGAMAYEALHDDARACWWLRQAAQYDAAHNVELWRTLAAVEMRQKHYLAGYDAAKRAAEELAQQPGQVSPEFMTSLLAIWANCALQIGKAQEAVALYRQAAELAVDFKDRCHMYSSWLLAQHNLTLGEEEYGKAHRDYDKLFAAVHVEPLARRPQGRKIRVGYLSPDFRQHVMFYFYYQLLGAHDADQFELYAYSLSPVQDNYTELVRKVVEHFVDISSLSYVEAAARIRQDKIDILVDLGGHCANSGLPILAWRPAPVQISGLGYTHQTGLSAVDYFLTDGWTDSENSQKEWQDYHEQPVKLTSQFCYTGRSDLPASQGAPCQTNGYITFGVFNRYLKITDEMLLLWREIMAQIPDSRLLLKSELFGEPAAQLMVQKRLRELGLEVDRITLEPATMDYMQRYLGVDIALDTYPYPGGGTTCDALYMGVPVISLYGKRRDTRFGLTLLQNAGLGELAVKTPEEYIVRAVSLAQDKEFLQVLHQNLRNMLLQSPLMDTSRYMAELEAMYRQMLEKVGRTWT
ncbi:hypothetical protein FZ041_06715 [Selenomonas caprae]|uniref:O-GlcNAc transferase C-terminal domain-containing protein n=1 Tax=Selenomonas caprae TaxID=2606905 RepID=A0A5D6WPD3_9FIRM|nr:hypothetical protein [Selenomonas caprae]TYZ28995.1 hypothetical protein FZ041_06715 [Selenomonas caprae]